MNGLEYKNDILNRFSHSEGAVILNSSGAYEYEYTLKDHLGNNRVTFSDANNDGVVGVSDIKQINNYYPFGMDMEGNWNGSFVASGTAGNASNAYKYNGKEWNNDYGLGWYNYGARWYATDAPRWTTIDPLSAEMLSHSPYNYAFDNPVRFTDPDGMKPLDDIYLNSEGFEIHRIHTDQPDHYYEAARTDHGTLNVTADLGDKAPIPSSTFGANMTISLVNHPDVVKETQYREMVRSLPAQGGLNTLDGTNDLAFTFITLGGLKAMSSMPAITDEQ